MKITSGQKIKLGLFVILTSAILVVALYFIGRKQNIFGNNFQVSAVFSNVNGLKLGNNVRYSGINVGTVRNIVMINDSTICVDMVVESSILPHLRQNAVASIGSDGLVGSMVLNIFPGSGPAELLQPGDTIKSVRRISTNEMMSTLSITNENAAELSSELLRLVNSLNQGQGSLGLLINDEEMGQDLKSTVKSLKTASAEASATIADLKGHLEDIDQQQGLLYLLLKDTVAANEFRSVLTNLDQTSEKINSVALTLEEVSENIKEGEGTLNYLVNDTVLVNDIETTVKNVRQGSVMLNENLEAMRQHVLFRGYFKKMEKKEKKKSK